MNKLLTLIFVAAGLLAAVSARAQEPTAPKALTPNEVGVTPGVLVTGAPGYFASPDHFHRLTFGMVSNLGTSEKSPSFGYDNLAIQGRWKAGTNSIGRRLNLLAGFADWREPAYRKVFPTTLIDPLPKQERFGAQSTTSASLGVSLAFGRDEPAFSAAENDALQKLVEAADSKISVATGLSEEQINSVVGKAKEKAQEKDKDKPFNEQALRSQIARWKSVLPTPEEYGFIYTLGLTKDLIDSMAAKPKPTEDVEEAERKFEEGLASVRRTHLNALRTGGSFSAGGLLRLGGFSPDTDVQAFDLFATTARGFVLADGSSVVDFVFTLHHLAYVVDGLPKSSTSLSGGAYIDLSGGYPAPVLGLTASYGTYRFSELHSVVPEAADLPQNPRVRRLDLGLSIAGAPDKSKQSGASVGIRYTRVNPSLLPSYNLWAVTFSSNFSLIK